MTNEEYLTQRIILLDLAERVTKDPPLYIKEGLWRCAWCGGSEDEYSADETVHHDRGCLYLTFIGIVMLIKNND